MIDDRHCKGKVNYVDEIIHVMHTPHGVSHFLHRLLHLVHLLLQVWYLLSSNASGLISSFGTILYPSILQVLLRFLPFCTSISTVLLPSEFLNLLR